MNNFKSEVNQPVMIEPQKIIKIQIQNPNKHKIEKKALKHKENLAKKKSNMKTEIKKLKTKKNKNLNIASQKKTEKLKQSLFTKKSRTDSLKKSKLKIIQIYNNQSKKIFISNIDKDQKKKKIVIKNIIKVDLNSKKRKPMNNHNQSKYLDLDISKNIKKKSRFEEGNLIN
jgi:hypothetical protein